MINYFSEIRQRVRKFILEYHFKTRLLISEEKNFSHAAYVLAAGTGRDGTATLRKASGSRQNYPI